MVGDLQSSIREVRILKIELKSVSIYYRISTRRFGELQKVGEEENIEIDHSPAYFDVRFIKHVIRLCEVIWKNLECILKHCKGITEHNGASKTDKAIAQGFLRL